MQCASCDADTQGQPFCPRCGKLSARPPGATHFDLFGLAPRHALDASALERRFRELSLKLHPDRFAKADARERRISLEQTTALNDAYKALKDPTRRAYYLLKLKGVDLDREEQGATSEALRALTAPPMEFLEEVMELREQLDGARRRKDVAAAQAMGAEVAKRRAQALAEAVEALDALEARPKDEGALKKAAQGMGRVRYFTRFLEEVEAIEEEALA